MTPEIVVCSFTSDNACVRGHPSVECVVRASIEGVCDSRAKPMEARSENIQRLGNADKVTWAGGGSNAGVTPRSQRGENRIFKCSLCTSNMTTLSEMWGLQLRRTFNLHSAFEAKHNRED